MSRVTETNPKPPDETDFGEAWTYESIVGALPGIDVSERLAVAIQFVLFEVGVLVLAAVYGLWDAVLPATAAVVVAAAGSVPMVRIGDRIRSVDIPIGYRRLLFGSNIEVVLAVLAYIALIIYLFSFGFQTGETSLIEDLLGEEPPVLALYLLLLILWDLCYRIGTAWWASVVALWRSYKFDFDPETRRTFQRADLETLGFGFLQLALVPFVSSQPVLVAVLVGHVAAVFVVTGGSIWLLSRDTNGERPTI
jgi:hypothetical protein